ncbi:MAG: hypothetical protein A2X84_09600 [Desulfuromonadaceae bacterium GWC2_58_13]|nr:MAG: hypothetical protein A2X84_09600 [Desulfuromonadaceae bacterium GWC2_58_13]
MNRERRPRMKKAATMGSLIVDMLQKRGLEDKVREYRTWQIWDETVGPQIAARARPVRIREGVLEIRVDQPVWMQQLQLMKPKILGRLNERLGGGILKDLFLRQGRITPPPVLAPPPKPPEWLDQPLSDADRDEIETALGTLDDSELKERLRRILTLQKQVARSKER